MNNFILILILILVVIYFFNKKEKFILLRDESECASIKDMNICSSESKCVVRDDLYKGTICTSKEHNQSIENGLNNICPY
jgi:hypothetical protein